MIIFDEYKYALNLLKNGFAKNTNFKDLGILAKYYRYSGLGDVNIRKELHNFCQRFSEYYNFVFIDNILNKIIPNSKKYEIKFANDVVISEEELNNIHKLNNYRYEKFLFLILVIAKNNSLNSKKNESDYYINEKFTILSDLAHIFLKKDERNQMRYELVRDGYLEPNNITKYNVKDSKEHYKLLYGDNTSGSMILVNDLNKIVSFYPFYCDICKKPMKKKSNRQKYCEECQKLIDRERQH